MHLQVQLLTRYLTKCRHQLISYLVNKDVHNKREGKNGKLGGYVHVIWNYKI